MREKLNILENTVKEEDNPKLKKRGLKLNLISRKAFGMTREGKNNVNQIVRGSSGGDEHK